jgi:hypothetical protein
VSYVRGINTLGENQKTTSEVLDLSRCLQECGDNFSGAIEREEDMQKNLVRIFVGLVTTASVLMWNPTSKFKSVAVLAETTGCVRTTLNGTYGFAFAGYFGDSSPFTPVAGAGTFTFQTDGTVHRRANASFGGGLFSLDDGGTYVLNQDCSFSANVPGETWDLIPVNEGKQLEFFVNTPLRTAAGTMTRQ